MKTMLAAAVAGLMLAASSTAVLAQDYTARPTYGTSNLVSGFEPDPIRVQLESGGDINASERSNGQCQGFIADAPDYRVNWTAGDGSLPLVFSTSGRADTTLIVNGPDGSWYCNDDGGNNPLSASITFRRPASGQYDIWVGTYGRAAIAPATLLISELYSD